MPVLWTFLSAMSAMSLMIPLLMLMKLLKDGSCCWWNMLMVDWPEVKERETDGIFLLLLVGWLVLVV